MHDVLEKQDPICVIAFFAYYQSRMPVSRIAQALLVPTMTVDEWLRTIQTKTIRKFRELGVEYEKVIITDPDHGSGIENYSADRTINDNE